jgi:hypothetical protein
MDIVNKLHGFSTDAQEYVALPEALFALSGDLTPIITGSVLNRWQPVTF